MKPIRSVSASSMRFHVTCLEIDNYVHKIVRGHARPTNVLIRCAKQEHIRNVLPDGRVDVLRNRISRSFIMNQRSCGINLEKEGKFDFRNSV